MNKDSILEVSDLSIEFGSEGGWRRVVEGVTFELERGRTLGIVGESGSGKSVTTMGLMGLLPKNALIAGGKAMFGGHDLLAMGEDELRKVRGGRISMIFQEPMTSLNPVQRCGAQVVEMLRQHEKVSSGEARRRTIELFDEVLLPRPEKIFDSYPHEISGGQKQRVMIAMALICHPDILIADEPTTALDVTVQKTILALLKDLQKRHGTSIIFITHDLGVIAQVADDILVMYHGKIVEQGTVDQILRNPKEPYTKGLLACRPSLERRPKHLPTVHDYMEGLPPDTSERKLHIIAEGERPLVSVRDLDVTYTLKRNLWGKPLQQLKGVDGVSFDIYEGETMGLVGESGCGKTTLGRAMLRLIDHSSGQIVYRGRPLDTLSPGEMKSLRPKLQIIFQDPYSSLNPRITIGDAILEPLLVHDRKARKKELRERVVDLMRQVGLEPDWYDRYPHEFSGGQRQRICIARALILEPELVVCDESVSALDVSVQAQVLNLLNDLKERHRFTYLFITHDLSVVKFISDRIMVMRKGQIVESSTADDLYANPQSDYTRTLIDSIPRID